MALRVIYRTNDRRMKKLYTGNQIDVGLARSFNRVQRLPCTDQKSMFVGTNQEGAQVEIKGDEDAKE